MVNNSKYTKKTLKKKRKTSDPPTRRVRTNYMVVLGFVGRQGIAIKDWLLLFQLDNF